VYWAETEYGLREQLASLAAAPKAKNKKGKKVSHRS